MPKKRTLKEFYNTFLTKAVPKEDLKTSQAYNLYKTPIKDKGNQVPHMYGIEPNSVYQADLCYMPNDDGYKYFLVVVDVATGKTEAEPLKERTANSVKKAFEKIFKRKILKPPKYILQTDQGTEFRGELKTYIQSKGITLRYAKVGRSRQQAFAEARNKTIAKALFMRMSANELETGEQDNDWVEFLPDLIKELNKHVEPTEQPEKALPNITKNTIVLSVGQNVRVQLDKPTQVSGKKLTGNFRATDIRWSPTLSKITNVIMNSGQPILYQVDDKPSPAYTYNQLQVVNNNQEKPVEYTGSKYIVEKIIEKLKKSNKVYYKVQWKNYPNPSQYTDEPRTELIKTPGVKKLIEEFEKK